MIDVVEEFPFVASLPKREKSRFANLLESIKEHRQLTQKHGSLLPVAVAAAFLGVSKQAVHSFLDSGRLEKIEFHGHVFVSEIGLIEFAKIERKSGRPFKHPQGVSGRLASLVNTVK
jgi:hypothetical protein